MNKNELINTLFATSTGASKAAIERVVNDLTGVIVQQLQTTGKFTLHGIGTLAVVESAARTGHHPQTGERIQIAAKKRVKLKACKALKAAVDR